MIPLRVVVVASGVVSERLSIITVDAIDHFSTVTDTKAIAAVGRLVDVQGLLVQVEIIPFFGVAESCTWPKVDVVERPVTCEGTVRSGLVAELRPTANGHAVAPVSEEAKCSF